MIKATGRLGKGFNSEMVKSEKNYAVAVILSSIFGVFGIQHFYLGRYALGFLDLGLSISGIIYLANGHVLESTICFGADILHTIWVTVELFIGKFKDGNGHVVCYPGQKLQKDFE